jgi:NADH-quinone oxidoreductase subunit N
VLAALVPVATLAVDGGTRRMFGGAFVVDPYSIALTGFFLVAAYVTLLLSVDYIGDGDYYQGEFYVLLLTSLLGMMVMSSARDLITIFVALETISIPTFVLAGWRKHDPKSNEAAIKYYLIGVLSSAIMLYGMSLVFGLTGSTMLSDISHALRHTPQHPQLLIVAVFLTLVGFAFKISAVPFHFWAPDTYEGAPTPVTAFLSVSSKAGGFVALLTVVFFGFFHYPDSWQPVLWVLAVASIVLGNLAALRQTNIVRMLAYSSIAQGGFILVPFAVAADGSARQSSFEAVVIYLLIYGAMNLGAFACVIAFARRTRSAEISTYGGLGSYAPGFALVMSVFLLSLAGIPPLAGWFAKFVMFRSVLDAGTPGATVLGVIAAIMSVVAFFYYMRVVREMWFHQVPETLDAQPIQIPFALNAAMGICAAIVFVVGIYPQVFARIGELAAGG